MNKPPNAQATIDLNPPALKPAPDAPWRDDALQRRGIGAELDELVATLVGGAEPVAIALDGGYGTGKTFILERWVQEMVGRGQIAMYYNAWENDCDDDPLVSLIETLLPDDTEWGRRLARASSEALTGFLRKYTGVDAQRTWQAGKHQPVNLLDAPRHRRESRQKLRGILAEIVDAARENGPSGVVVVVDELDRCRPTFATELMERVKHVLNVQGLIFVFGVNMATLRETVKAVYGNIDAHQYLLRMFTTSLTMPPGVAFFGSKSDQAAHMHLQGLANRHGLRAFCSSQRLLQVDMDEALHLLRIVSAAGKLTPRELEHVMWLLSKVAATSLSPEGLITTMYPTVLVPLAVARIKNPDAYYQTVSSPDEAVAVINCFFELIHEVDLEEWDLKRLDRLEMTMYRVCHQHPPSSYGSQPPAHLALSAFASEDGAATLDERHLAQRSTGITRERAKAMLKVAPREGATEVTDGAVVRVIWNFEALQGITSRFDVIWPRGSEQ